MKTREGGGRRRWLRLASALVLVAGCERLIGIEDLSSRADSGDLDGSSNPGVMLGSAGDGGEFIPPPPPNRDCLNGATDCLTSEREGLCGPGGICTEYCIMNVSRIDRCLLR
jgi:hypothetical protein